VEARPGGPQRDGGGFAGEPLAGSRGGLVGEPLAGSRGRGQAPPLHLGWSPPCLIVAPDLLCSLKAFALRSTRHPLSNHPHKPLAPMVPRSLGRSLSRGHSKTAHGDWKPGAQDLKTSGPQKTVRRFTGCLNPTAHRSAEGMPVASTPSPQRSAGASDGRCNPHCLGSVDQDRDLLVQTASRTCPRQMQLWAFDARLGAPCGDQWASLGRRQLLPYITQLEGAGA